MKRLIVASQPSSLSSSFFQEPICTENEQIYLLYKWTLIHPFTHHSSARQQQFFFFFASISPFLICHLTVRIHGVQNWGASDWYWPWNNLFVCRPVATTTEPCWDHCEWPGKPYYPFLCFLQGFWEACWWSSKVWSCPEPHKYCLWYVLIITISNYIR